MELIAHFTNTKPIAEKVLPNDDAFMRTDLDWMEPLKISEFTASWPALHLWNQSFLIDQTKDKLLHAKRITNGLKETKNFGLRDYFDYMENNTGQNPFYLTDCQFHLGTEMAAHYTVPQKFKCWYREIDSNKRKSTLSWLYIGAKHSQSPLHLDIWNTSAWNVVVTGCKLWLFFPPHDQEYLYEGKVNPFNPDYTQYPEFSKATPIVCIQHPGEMIYTPSAWWHAVYNIDPGISITENFINTLNYTHVLAFFKEHSQASYDSINKIVKQHTD